MEKVFCLFSEDAKSLAKEQIKAGFTSKLLQTGSLIIVIKSVGHCQNTSDVCKTLVIVRNSAYVCKTACHCQNYLSSAKSVQHQKAI